jgi:NAD(P)-dependent dehydrogenase (short-subunit alcohol dehydrogenase family)
MKTVLVTGASGGIGHSTCLLFLEKGWQVLGLDITESLISHENYHFHQKNLSNRAEIKDFVSSVQSLDCIVNNAAIQISKPFSEITEEDWDKTISVNLKAIFFLIQNALPLLKSKQGNVVNISSVHAVATSKSISPYAISKSALVGLSKSLAIELAEFGIRVNTILPAAVDTPMLRSGLMRGHLQSQDVEDSLKELGRKHVIGRVGQTSEIAQAIYFLADSSQSSFITGASLLVDGGTTIKLSTE